MPVDESRAIKVRPSVQGRLAGRVAVITGGASGIGRATAELMAACQAVVVVADLNSDSSAEVAEGIRREGSQALAVTVDVADENSVSALVSKVVVAFGGIDVLVNSAAITDRRHQASDGALAEMDFEVWNRAMAVDLGGTMLMCKHVLPVMVERGHGAIVNISSNSSLGGDLVLSAYAAAKAGVNSLTRSIATAYGKAGIRCNTVSPAAIQGPTFAANVPRPIIEAMEANCLLPYPGRPADVAEAIVFLASDQSRFITGQLLNVDGGMLATLPHVSDLRRLGLDSVVPDLTRPV